MGEHDEAFEDLIERSSLGTPGARQLRRRTSRSQIDAVRRIVELRNQMFHSSGSQSVQAADALIRLLRELGYHGQAGQVLAEAFSGPKAGAVVQAALMLAGRADREYDEPKAADLIDEEPTRAADVESLWRWLDERPELYARRVDQGSHLDISQELLVAVVTTAAGAIAAIGFPAVAVAAASLPALARALKIWLTTRRPEVAVTVTGPYGRQVLLDARRIENPERLLREGLEDEAT